MKKLLLAVALSFLFLFTPTAAAQSDPCKPAPAEYSNYAQKVYQQFNQEWFGNKLPSNTQVVVCQDAIIVPAAMAGTIPPTKPNEPYKIEISLPYNLAERQMEFTLLHEMVHIKLGMADPDYDGNHDEKFQHEMRILALEGAFTDLW